MMLPDTEEAQIWRPLVAKLMWAVIVALIFIGGLTYAVVRATSAAQQTQHTSNEVRAAVTCLNSILGQRGPLTNADTNAEIDLFAGIFAVLEAPQSQQAALYQELLRKAPGDLAILERDKKLRSDKPLGHC